MTMLYLMRITVGFVWIIKGCQLFGYTNIDPWENYNRQVIKLNLALAKRIFTPVSLFYQRHTPPPIVKSINNFAINLRMPFVALSYSLQGRVPSATKTLTRFMLNTVFGLCGLIDFVKIIAPQQPIPNSDFGDVLKAWKIPSGPYFVLPFVGPSTVRDTIGFVASFFFDPFVLINRHGNQPQITLYYTGLSWWAEYQIRLPLLSELEKKYNDPYVWIRNWYLSQKGIRIPRPKFRLIKEDQ